MAPSCGLGAGARKRTRTSAAAASTGRERARQRGGKRRGMRDLRGGMVDVIAALVADGRSEIEGIEEIDRGYERIDERLRELGARIERAD